MLVKGATCRHADYWSPCYHVISTLNPRQNGIHSADDTLKSILLYDKYSILIQISLKFIHRGLIYDMSALVQIMSLWRTDHKQSSETIMD